MTVCSISYLKFMQKGSHLYKATKMFTLNHIHLMYFHNSKLLLAFIDELQFKVANISQGFRINLLSLIT